MPRDSYNSEFPKQYGQKILILEEIQDPGNVGTLIRSAAAFNFDGILLSGGCADPFSPKAIQACAGSILSLWIRRTPEYLKMSSKLKEGGFRIVAADISGNSKSVIEDRGKLALVLGNEAVGVSNKMLRLTDTVYKIPFNMKSVESLNVAAAGAICMYLLNSAGSIAPNGRD